MRLTIPVILVCVFASCGPGEFHALTHDQKLPSGRTVRIVSCDFAWGDEHGERHADLDGFSLEYLATAPRASREAYERELLEVFELIRPVSEQWGLRTASVTALRNPERTGTYDTFAFTRATSGEWTHKGQVITRGGN